MVSRRSCGQPAGGQQCPSAGGEWTDVQSERDEQQALFNYYFRDRDLQYETELAKLKTEGSVPSWRIPYSAAIHPETAGGMSDARVAPTVGLFARRRQGVSASRGERDPGP